MSCPDCNYEECECNEHWRLHHEDCNRRWIRDLENGVIKAGFRFDIRIFKTLSEARAAAKALNIKYIEVLPEDRNPYYYSYDPNASRTRSYKHVLVDPDGDKK